MKETILVALLLACGTAQAVEWVLLGKTDDRKIAYYIDISSIRVTGLTRRAWFKSVYSSHTVAATEGGTLKWVTHFMARYAFNCSEEASRIESVVEYYEDGTNISGQDPVAWQPVAPETVFDNEMQFICAWKPK